MENETYMGVKPMASMSLRIGTSYVLKKKCDARCIADSNRYVFWDFVPESNYPIIGTSFASENGDAESIFCFINCEI